jgi:hypothetical protein
MNSAYFLPLRRAWAERILTTVRMQWKKKNQKRQKTRQRRAKDAPKDA